MKRENSGFYRKLYKVLRFIVISIIIFMVAIYFINAFYKKTYPLKYKEEVIEISNKIDIDPKIVFSVIKIESNFSESEISNKGAKGLMQLTDKTAEYIAKLNGVDSYNVFKPLDNITLGSMYLKYLLKKFNVLETAVCAYNAGEGNVSVWLKNTKYSNDGKTLKEIPFKETKEYIEKFKKTFLKYDKLYRNILDKSI